jgi:hypothetical protein
VQAFTLHLQRVNHDEQAGLDFTILITIRLTLGRSDRCRISSREGVQVILCYLRLEAQKEFCDNEEVSE